MDTTVPPINTPFWLDKSLWVAVFGPLLAVLLKKFGLNMDPAEVIGFVLTAVTYIVMNKWKTATVTKSVIANNAAASAVVTPSQAAAVLSGAATSST